jgi:predicted transposase YdaD
MANTFDKIFKEESETLIKAIATKILGITSFDNTEPVTASLQKTIEREPDWLRKICHDDAKKDFIFHGEVHGKDQEIILDRALVYFALLWSAYHLPVRQVVVYIGRKKKLTKMKAKLHLPNIDYRIEIINMYQIPYDLFINSTEPTEVILSILCDFKGEPPEDIITKILERLKTLDKEGLTLEKHLVQLEIIADLRNLQPLLTKIMDAMPITYNIKRDVRYKQGKLEGKLEGIIEGEIKGKLEGIIEGERKAALIKDQKFVINLLLKGIIEVETIAEFADVDVAFAEKTIKSYEKASEMAKSNAFTHEQIAEQAGLMLEVVEKYLKKH